MEEQINEYLKREKLFHKSTPKTNQNDLVHCIAMHHQKDRKLFIHYNDYILRK